MQSDDVAIMMCGVIEGRGFAWPRCSVVAFLKIQNSVQGRIFVVGQITEIGQCRRSPPRSCHGQQLLSQLPFDATKLVYDIAE